MAKKGKLKQYHQKGESKRPLRLKKYKQFFLIVCEDEETEPRYFEQFQGLFPEGTLYIRTVGTGRDPKGVIEQAIEKREEFKLEYRKEIDFVWAVFDKDDADENEAKIKRFNEAFQIAKRENIEIAYSNEAFELWLLLHITKVEKTNPLSRQEIYIKLQNQIRKSGERYKDYVYDHKKPKENRIVEIIHEIGHEEQAIQKASQLFNYHKNKKPIEANPSTKVHILVKELRNWIKFYNN
ncbi:abortive phage resistance protein [Beggiatoa sp. PS]|nr:abortive phage resistance protein [Beggiatoa sp. PS]